MRRLALLPAALLFTAIQLVAAEYGSLTRVTVAGTIFTPVLPPVSTTAAGITTLTERATTKSIASADILRAMVARNLIPSAAGYQLGLLKTATLDGTGEFIAYRPAGPATTARRVPTDLLSLHFETGPRQGQIQRNADAALISVNLTSRDYATLSVLDFEGTGILTQRFTNYVRLRSPQNQVVLLSGSGNFPGVNAPDTRPAGLGTLTVTFADSRIVDLAPYGNVAPPNPTNTSSGSVTLNSSSSTIGSTMVDVLNGATLGGTGSISSGTLTTTNGSIAPGSSSGALTLSGSNTFTGALNIVGGTIELPTTYKPGLTFDPNDSATLVTNGSTLTLFQSGEILSGTTLTSAGTLPLSNNDLTFVPLMISPLGSNATLTATP